MAALFGKIEAFNPQQEEWPQYVERLEQFFEANDLTGEDKAVKRRATFLSLIGPESYKLLRSLLAPAKPKEKSYAELVAKLTEHCNLQSNAVRGNAAFPIQFQIEKKRRVGCCLRSRVASPGRVLYITTEILWTKC